MATELSVILPVHNARPYIEAAVRSILAQTYRDFELLLIDDGSTDGSGEILEMLARQDPRIRLTRRANRGLVATLNEGLTQARGTLIARMDADDIALPGRLSRQVDYMWRHPECVAVGSQVLFIDAAGRVIAPRSDMRTEHEAIDRALLAGQWPMVHPTIVLRRGAAEQIGGPQGLAGSYRDFLTWEDHDLFLRLAEIGRLANLPEVLLQYRLHLGSVVHQRGGERTPVLQQILTQADQRRGLPVRRPEQLPHYRAPTVVEHERTWAWWALGAGNIRTARHYAWNAWWRSPLAPESWKLLACVGRAMFQGLARGGL